MDTPKKRCTAVVLAAGSGSRMHASTAKQFMMLSGKPLIWYSLQAVEQSEIIDDCILVTGKSDIPYVRQEIVEKHGFSKITDVIEGGDERYTSVCNAMRYIAGGRQPIPNKDGYVFIHDGARPFLTEEILRSTYEAVREYGACVAAVPSKDTVKLADEQGFAAATPDRRRVWNIQTPQVFETKLITGAYARLERELPRLREQGAAVTDDAGVVELFTERRVKLAMGAYENIKITTPEDLSTAEGFLRRRIPQQQ